jgi:ketosteroid isomerase-like protein
MTRALRDILWFDAVEIRDVHTTGRSDTVVCEYDAVLTRTDLDGRFRRRYIAVITLVDGRIGRLREYGGPFRPA